MNKQEVFDIVSTLKPDEQNLHEYQPEEWEAFKDGFDTAKCYAELAVEELDEPEKPLLSKKEAEWIEKLREHRPTPEEMIISILSPRGGCDFVFKHKDRTYMLPYKHYKGKEKYGSVRKRLVRAVLYGYNLKPLYTVEIPNTNYPKKSEHLVLCKDVDKIYLDFVWGDDWRTLEWTQLTEDEIKEDYEWAWNSGFAKEVTN